MHSHIHVLCYVLSECVPTDTDNCHTCMGSADRCTSCKPGKALDSVEHTCTNGMYENRSNITSHHNAMPQKCILV